MLGMSRAALVDKGYVGQLTFSFQITLCCLGLLSKVGTRVPAKSMKRSQNCSSKTCLMTRAQPPVRRLVDGSLLGVDELPISDRHVSFSNRVL
jgi:hypothetical protein